MLTRFRRQPPAPPPEPEAHIEWIGPYPSFEAARIAAADPGYHGDTAIDRYVRRYREVTADIAGTIRRDIVKHLPWIAAFGMAEPVDGVYEVLDYGGSWGAMYEVLRTLYPARNIRWTIVEVPELVARGAEMGASNSKVFTSEIPSGQFSLIAASGVLQCLDDPTTIWRQLRALEPGLMLLARHPVVPSLATDAIYVQQIPAHIFAARLPVWFFSPQEWAPLIEGAGELIGQWDSAGDETNFNGGKFWMQCYLLRKNRVGARLRQ